MSSEPGGEQRERVIRWIEEGQRMLSVLLGILDEYDRLRSMAETAEQECQRLREEVNQLRAENERFRREREAIVEALSKLMTDVLPRLQNSKQGDQRSSNSRRGKITYVLRQTRPGVTELVEMKR